MVFSSVVFLFAYLSAVLLGYYLIPAKWQLYFLFAANLVFYGWGEPAYAALMLLSIAINYGGAMLIDRYRGRARGTLFLTVAVNLLMLGYYKYFVFAAANLALLFPQIDVAALPNVTLPIGISFYTFQCMSYVIDVYRSDVPAQANPILFGTYVALFPQLIAGPIVRYSDVMREMKHRIVSWASIDSGARLFIIGLAKKLLLANPMGQLWEALKGSGNGPGGAWVGALAFTFQIYFDFCGYSEMAIGLGELMGFHFPRNFNYPYVADSITDFWRRWHITLSTWFRMYVYIPLGGNRKGAGRQMLNLLAVWFLTGLWHGANWNFVIWGMYFCALLILEKLFLGRMLKKAPAFVGHAYALFFIVIGWVLFSFTDFSEMSAYIAALFTRAETGAFSAGALRLTLAYLPLLCACAAASTPLPKCLWQRLGLRGKDIWEAFGALALLALCAAAVTSQSYNPFIYFRF
jgi:alginate O-acetyltransferase complex protein AlgI